MVTQEPRNAVSLLTRVAKCIASFFFFQETSWLSSSERHYDNIKEKEDKGKGNGRK